MKNTQKGSATVWTVIAVVLVVLVGGGIYVFNSSGGCRITDSLGKTTYHNPCPENKADYTFNANDNTDLGRIQQAIQDQTSNYLTNPPAGFLVPTAIPKGYRSLPPLFETDWVSYYYSTNKGYPADKNITFEERGSSHGMYGNFNQYNADAIKNSDRKIVKYFTYNGMQGKVFTYTSNTNPNYQLAYDHGSKLLIISATNDSSITPDILIGLLKTMTTGK